MEQMLDFPWYFQIRSILKVSKGTIMAWSKGVNSLHGHLIS